VNDDKVRPVAFVVGANAGTWRRSPNVMYGLVFLMLMVNYGDRAALSVAAPALSIEFSLSPSGVGWVLSSFLLTYSLAILPAAVLLDRYGARAVGALSVALWSVAMILGGAAGTLLLFVSARMLLGLGESPTYSLSVKAVRSWAPPARRGIVLTVVATGMHLGLAAAALFGTWLIVRVGWRGEFYLLGALGLVFALIFAFLYRDKGGSNYSATAAGFDLPSMIVVLKSRSFYSIVIAQCCGNYVGYLLISWLPTYLIQSQHFSLLQSGKATALCFCLASVVAISLTAGADRLRRIRGDESTFRPIVAAVLFLCGTCIAVLPVIQTYAALISLIAVVLACSIAGCANVAALYSELLIDGKRMGTVAGMIVTITNAFGIAAPVLTGYIVRWTASFANAFYVAAVLLVIGALSIVAVRHEPLDRPSRLV
jgi:MFS family permease